MRQFSPIATTSSHSSSLFSKCTTASKPSVLIGSASRAFSTSQHSSTSVWGVKKKKLSCAKRAQKKKASIPVSRRFLCGPQRKGVCVKVQVKAPKKPNSGQRKVALIKLSNGRLVNAYIPGEKANLQEHGVVLIRGGKTQDLPGCKHKVIRGKYDMN